MEIAKQLVNSMKISWDPARYHDIYQEVISQWLEEKARAQQKGKKTARSKAQTNVVDFMTLLKKSLPGKARKKTKTSTTKTAHQKRSRS
jgi:DNA end-binding protein Ku